MLLLENLHPRASPPGSHTGIGTQVCGLQVWALPKGMWHLPADVQALSGKGRAAELPSTTQDLSERPAGCEHTAESALPWRKHHRLTWTRVRSNASYHNLKGVVKNY